MLRNAIGVLGALLLLASWGTGAATQRGLPSGGAPAERRVALVIGNGAYRKGALRNPVNDARAVAARLERMGFEVTRLLNADKRAMEQADRDFARKLGGEHSVGLFYFAGHGVELEGQNYLVPIGADIQGETDVRYEAVNAGRVLDGMRRAGNGLNLVILDACRNNPYARGFRSASRGLAEMRPASGTLILYAAEPGQVASDGEGDNGLFTENLLAALERPGLTVEQVFKRTALEVSAATGGRQTPWQEGVILGSFYFVPAPPGAPGAVPMPPGSVPVQTADPQILVWQACVQSGNAACYRAYLAQYPQGRFAATARAILGATVPPPPPPGPPAPDPAAVEQRLGLERAERRRIQEALNALGHAVGAADGIWGRNTRTGIEAWQRGAGREATGYLTAEGYKALLGQAESVLAAQREREAAQRVAREREAALARAEAERKAREQAARRGLEPEMVAIRGGWFQMGSPSSEGGRDSDERQHRVQVDGFEMGKHEVTQAQWREVMGNNPSHFSGCDRCPVEQVSWNDVQEYIRKLNARTGGGYRLPTEAEWEYAARAGTTGPFSFSGPISADKVNYDANYTYGGSAKGQYRKKTVPVGSLPANPWGLHEVHGNVWEWTCSDWDGDYGGGEQRCSSGGAHRALRGGSWDGFPSSVRSARRVRVTPGARRNYLGFRLARTK